MNPMKYTLQNDPEWYRKCPRLSQGFMWRRKVEESKKQKCFCLASSGQVLTAAEGAREARPVIVFADLNLASFSHQDASQAAELCRVAGGAILVLITTLKPERPHSCLHEIEESFMRDLKLPDFTLFRFFIATADGSHGYCLAMVHEHVCKVQERIFQAAGVGYCNPPQQKQNRSSLTWMGLNSGEDFGDAFTATSLSLTPRLMHPKPHA